MSALRTLSLLFVLGLASTAQAAFTEYAYESLGTDGDNNASDLSEFSCTDFYAGGDGCYAKGGRPCNTNPRQFCDYQTTPAFRCARGNPAGLCLWPAGGGVCASNGDVACLSDGGVATGPSVMCADLGTDICDMSGNNAACGCSAPHDLRHRLCALARLHEAAGAAG